MPRSLARTAVHPPHRIGAKRARTPLRIFGCILLSIIVAVLLGISYFSFDIWRAKSSSSKKPVKTSDIKFIHDTHTIAKPTVHAANILKNQFNRDMISKAMNPKTMIPKTDSIVQNKIESLVKPNRVNVVSEVVEARLVDIPAPDVAVQETLSNIEDNGDNDESKDLELDEPFDEEAATHINITREDIDPTNEECKIRFDQISEKNVWQYDLSKQSSMLENNEYIDWWDYPIQYQTKLSNNKYCNTIHKGSYELHKTRKDWFEKMKKDNKVKNINSNKFDENGCVTYKMDDSYVQWHPPSELLCKWTNNAIFWHTMHGTKIGWDFRKSKVGEHWVWDLSVELNDARQNNKCECPSNVAFIFADNQMKEKGHRLIEQSYENCNKNCNFFHVAQSYEPWDWFGKIGPVLDLISNETFQNQFEYAVLTDADDQQLVQSPINIVDKFNIYEADMVIGGEDTSYPHWMQKEKAHENRASPWSKHHQHLNAGGFMGNIKKMIPFLEYMKEDYRNFTKLHEDEIKAGERNRWRDQTCFREMYRKFYPKIKVDSLALLWSRVDIYMYDL